MSAELVELRPKLDCEDVVKALRNVADDLEAGRYDFDPTLAVLVLGREATRRDRDAIVDSYQFQSHGFGQCSFFASKGLLASALGKFEDRSE